MKKEYLLKFHKWQSLHYSHFLQLLKKIFDESRLTFFVNFSLILQAGSPTRPAK